MVTAATTVIGVIGEPIAHSLSPTIHNAALAAMGRDWVSVAFPTPEGQGAAAIGAMTVLGIRGLSVTMPHKAAAAAACDRLDPSAARLGVVNCVHNDAGTLVGYNTDGDGFVDALQHRAGVTIDGASIAVLGAGGAARSIVEALGRNSPRRIAVINRTASRADDVAELAPMAEPTGIGAVGDADVVINTTSVGMGVAPDAGGDYDPATMPCDPALVMDDAVAVDIIYHPLRTRWLEALANRGMAVHNGVDMLVAQAAIQLRIFTGETPDMAAMTDAATRAITGATAAP